MITADIAFILICTILVSIITPGLAFFYGGLLRRKNIISMFAMCFISIVLVGIIWVLLGYSLAFAPDLGYGLIDNFNYFGLISVDAVTNPSYSTKIPPMLFMIFQLMLAAITVAIISSPFVKRAKFISFIIFIVL